MVAIPRQRRDEDVEAAEPAAASTAAPGAGPSAAPTKEEVRRQNLGALLRWVHVHGATSRAELTARLGLNRSTIGALAADLAHAGLVSEEAPAETRQPGRPSLVVRPRSAAVYAVALSIEVDRLRAARVGLGGEVLDRRDTDRARGGPLLDAVPPLARLVAEMAAPAGSRCVGGGVAVTPAVRAADGTVRMNPHGRWYDEPLAASLGAALPGRPPFAAGTLADVGALAEHTRGAAMGLENVIYLHGDVGVGGGIIADGRRVTGHRGSGGDTGHMVVNPRGRPCPCGSRGCWDTEVGEHALLARAGRTGTGGTGDTGDTGAAAVRAVLAGAHRGDEPDRAAVRQVADWLGFGVANLVNIFNPEAVVFGGTLRELYAACPDLVKARLDTMALPVCREHVRLRTSVLGDDAPLLGAAELAFERLLADPLADPLDASAAV